MSKSLVLKALNLLQEDIGDKPSKNNAKSSLKKQKKSKQISGPDSFYAPVDRTAENIILLKQLKCLKPKTSVAQKVVEYYTKPRYSEEKLEKTEQYHSVLFDDDGDDDNNDTKHKRKKRKRVERDSDF